MTAQEVIATIRAEIERRRDSYLKMHSKYGRDTDYIAATEDLRLLEFLSTLESENPIDGLEDEIITRWNILNRAGNDIPFDTFNGIASHFAQWGAEHAKIESEKPVPNDLEEAAEISFDEAYALTEDYRDFLAKGLTEKRPRPFGPHWFCEYAKNRFIAGAKWQKEQDLAEMAQSKSPLSVAYANRCFENGKQAMKEQMMKEAKEVRVQSSPLNGPLGISAYCCNFPSEHPFYRCKEGDKVKLIIVKEGEK